MPESEQFSIPITYAHTHTNVRLLELPPDLLTLLDESPTDTPLLSFKSPQQSAHQNASAPSHIVLTTPNRTYQIREVQTSNSVFLLRPRQDSASHDEDTIIADDMDISNGAAVPVELEICAQAPSYLETTPLPAPTPSNRLLTPAQWLTRLVPQYTTKADVDPDLASPATSKIAIWADIPYSSGEIQAAWAALLAFETEGQSFRPAENVLADLWADVTTAAGAEGIPLSGDVHVDTVWDAMTGDAPRGLYDTVLVNLSTQSTSAVIPSILQLDRKKTVTWTGKTLLSLSATAAPDAAVDVPGFLAKWADALPEQWRQDATPEAMADLQNQAADGAESAKVKDLVEKAGLKTEQKGTVGGAKEAVQKRGGPTRDWHERFKKMRK